MAKKETDKEGQNHKKVSMQVIDCPIANKKWHGMYVVKANLVTYGNGSVIVLCAMHAACWAHDNEKCPYERQAK